MQHYVGLDVSVKETSVCIVDKAGKVIREVMPPAGFFWVARPTLRRRGLKEDEAAN